MLRIKRYLPLLLLLMLTILWLVQHYFVINTSRSMPVGLYFLSHPTQCHRNDIVLACLPPTIVHLAVTRRYVMYGNCHGAEPIVKYLIALPNDQVVVTPTMITVNSEVYLAPKLTTDTAVRPLPLPTVTAGYWLLGNNLHSFDSRYFGPVATLKGKLTPLLTW